GCQPSFDDRTPIVEGARILAVQSVPAEAAPNAGVSLRALAVDSGGTLLDPAIDWALCRERKPLTETGPISPACFTVASPELVSLGNGAEVTGQLFADACRLFGPNPPEAKKGEPAGRPVDPDLTGGFYVPSRLLFVDDDQSSYTTGQTRLACDPGRVTPEQSREFRRLYRANENPAIARLALARGAHEETIEPASSGAPSLRVSPGEAVTLRVEWPGCPIEPVCGDSVCGAGEDAEGCAADCREPHGCGGGEPYVAFNPLTLALEDRREGMRVSWYATAGHFDIGATGTTEAEPFVTASANRWIAPATSGIVHLWVVLRDDRRGVGWETYDLEIGR
ncbi:MAG: hypothetical protein ABW133_01725, partial [Polyangiaceae bacterium]